MLNSDILSCWKRILPFYVSRLLDHELADPTWECQESARNPYRAHHAGCLEHPISPIPGLGVVRLSSLGDMVSQGSVASSERTRLAKPLNMCLMASSIDQWYVFLYLLSSMVSKSYFSY